MNLGKMAWIDEWLDEHVSQDYKDQPLAQDWARISKITEEAGEAIDAFIGVSGENPRKGIYGSMSDVMDELCDVVITALLAMQHFLKDEDAVIDLVEKRWEYRIQAIISLSAPGMEKR